MNYQRQDLLVCYNFMVRLQSKFKRATACSLAAVALFVFVYAIGLIRSAENEQSNLIPKFACLCNTTPKQQTEQSVTPTQQTEQSVTPAQQTEQSVTPTQQNLKNATSSAYNVPTVIHPLSVSDMHNAVEDAKLHHFLVQERHRIHGVIIILANGARTPLLHQSLGLLYKNFNNRFRYPVVIFHEANLFPTVESIRPLGVFPGSAVSSIFFQQVELKVPQSFTDKFGQPPPLVHWGRVSYRNMCRFHAKLFYEQPVLRYFDYYWRLDDDSMINANIDFDVFAELTSGNYSYGFYQSMIDEYAASIHIVTAGYMKLKRIKATFFDKLKWKEIFYNNFEVSSLSFWRSRQYKEFMDYIDSLGGIYSERWGDAPIKSLALSLYVDLKRIYRYRNISYSHHGIGAHWDTRFLLDTVPKKLIITDQDKGKQADKGKQEDNGNPADEGKQQDKRKQEDKGKQQDKGKHQDKGKQEDKGKQQDKGKHQDKGKQEDKGKPQDKGKQEDKEKQRDKGKQEDRGK